MTCKPRDLSNAGRTATSPKIGKLLGTANTKTMRGEAYGVMTFILHLAPARLSGYNTCPKASIGCAASCLNTAGLGKFDNVQAARVRKTMAFFENRDAFLAQLVKDVAAGIRRGRRAGMRAAFRLNGTSDIRWESIPVTRDGVEYPNIMAAFPDAQFYDYTKISNRRGIPANYHLTFSRSESNAGDVARALAAGMNVAAVFADALPATWLGLPVIDGTETDLRFTDPRGVIVGLVAKGKAMRDTSGFVIRDAGEAA